MARLTLTNIDFASVGKIVNAVDPVALQDGATLNFVNNSISAISSKPPVDAVATTNQVSMTGLAVTVDGVALNGAGMRVLLTAQTTASQNGPWVVGAGAWSRPAMPEVVPYSEWIARGGTVGLGQRWRLTTTGAIVVGTTSLTLSQAPGGGATYTAGFGLTLTGSSFAVTPKAAGGIIADATGVSVDTTVFMRRFSVAVGDGASTSITVTHNLGTTDVLTHLYTVSNGSEVEADILHATSNTLTLVFLTAPASGAYRCVVMG